MEGTDSQERVSKDDNTVKLLLIIIKLIFKRHLKENYLYLVYPYHMFFL
jgi:hypothetical protein